MSSDASSSLPPASSLVLGAICIRVADSSTGWQYIFWRALGVVAAIWVLAAVRGPVSPARQIGSLAPIAWLGAASMTVSSATFISALEITTLAETFFLSSLAPLIAAGLARAFLGERIGVWTIAAIVLGLGGVSIMIGGSGIEGGSAMGRALALVSAFSFASYSLCTRWASTRDLDAMLIVFGMASVALAYISLQASGLPLVARWQDAVLAFAHGAVVLSGGLLLLAQGSRHVSAVTLTVLAQAESVLAPIWGYLFFAERPPFNTVLGGLVIVAAVILQAARGERPASSRPN